MSGELRTSLYIEGNAAGAKTAAGEAQVAISGLKSNVQAAAEKFAGLSAEQKSAEASAQVFIKALDAERAKFDGIRASIDPVFESNRRYEQIVTDTRSAVALGAVSQEEANAVLAQAATRYGQVAAAAGLNRIQQLEAMHVSRELITMWASGVPIEQAFGMEAARIATFFQSGEGGVAGALAASAGALKSFLAGLVEFVGPWNLAIAGIAAGGAAVAYFSGAFESGKPTLKEYTASMKSLADESAKYSAATRQVLTPMSSLRKEFGMDAKSVRSLYDAMRDLTLLKFDVGFSDAVSKMAAPMEGMSVALQVIEKAQAKIDQLKKTQATITPGSIGSTAENTLRLYQQQIEIFGADLNRKFGVSADQAKQVADAWKQVTAATDELGKAAALDHFRKTVMDIRDSSGQIPKKLRDWAQSATELAIKGYTVADAMHSSAQSARDLAGVDASGPIRAAASAAELLAGNLADALSKAESLARTAITNAYHQQAIDQNRLDTVGKPVKRAANKAVIDYRFGLPDGGYSLLTSGNAGYLASQEASVRDSAASAAQTKTAADKADAANTKLANGALHSGQSITQLIASLKAEHDAIVTLDPVQQQLLKYRRQLAGATETQISAVEMLVAQNIAEKQAIKNLTDEQTFFASTAYTAFDGLITKGQSFADVMANIGSAIANAVIQGELLGTGPLAGLFGLQSSTAAPGGLLGMVANAFVGGGSASVGGTAEHLGHFAGGGMIYGAGTGTSDEIPIRASNGEYIVNAAATAKNRPILDAINSGATLPGLIPGFAMGGPIGGGAALQTQSLLPMFGGRASSMELHVHVHGAKGNAEIRQMVDQGVEAGLDHYDKQVLPYSIKRVHEDPWGVGG